MADTTKYLVQKNDLNRIAQSIRDKQRARSGQDLSLLTFPNEFRQEIKNLAPIISINSTTPTTNTCALGKISPGDLVKYNLIDEPVFESYDDSEFSNGWVAKDTETQKMIWGGPNCQYLALLRAISNDNTFLELFKLNTDTLELKSINTVFKVPKANGSYDDTLYNNLYKDQNHYKVINICWANDTLLILMKWSNGSNIYLHLFSAIFSADSEYIIKYTRLSSSKFNPTFSEISFGKTGNLRTSYNSSVLESTRINENKSIILLWSGLGGSTSDKQSCFLGVYDKAQDLLSSSTSVISGINLSNNDILRDTDAGNKILGAIGNIYQKSGSYYYFNVALWSDYEIQSQTELCDLKVSTFVIEPQTNSISFDRSTHFDEDCPGPLAGGTWINSLSWDNSGCLLTVCTNAFIDSTDQHSYVGKILAVTIRNVEDTYFYLDLPTVDNIQNPGNELSKNTFCKWRPWSLTMQNKYNTQITANQNTIVQEHLTMCIDGIFYDYLVEWTGNLINYTKSAYTNTYYIKSFDTGALTQLNMPDTDYSTDLFIWDFYHANNSLSGSILTIGTCGQQNTSGQEPLLYRGWYWRLYSWNNDSYKLATKVYDLSTFNCDKIGIGYLPLEKDIIQFGELDNSTIEYCTYINDLQENDVIKLVLDPTILGADFGYYNNTEQYALVRFSSNKALQLEIKNQLITITNITKLAYRKVLFTVTFKTNDGSETIAILEHVIPGSDITFSGDTPTKNPAIIDHYIEYYEFNGWNKKPNTITNYPDFGLVISEVASNLILYASFKILSATAGGHIPVQYTIIPPTVLNGRVAYYNNPTQEIPPIYTGAYNTLVCRLIQPDEGYYTTQTNPRIINLDENNFTFGTNPEDPPITPENPYGKAWPKETIPGCQRMMGLLMQGTLPTGISILQTYRQAWNTTGNTFSPVDYNTVIYYGDKFYWQAAATAGYSQPSITYDSINNYYTWEPASININNLNSVETSGVKSGTKVNYKVNFPESLLWLDSTDDTQLADVSNVTTQIGDTISLYFQPVELDTGDINGDGQIDTEDVSALFNYLANGDTTLNNALADINNDGKVSVGNIGWAAYADPDYNALDWLTSQVNINYNDYIHNHAYHKVLVYCSGKREGDTQPRIIWSYIAKPKSPNTTPRDQSIIGQFPWDTDYEYDLTYSNNLIEEDYFHEYINITANSISNNSYNLTILGQAISQRASYPITFIADPGINYIRYKQYNSGSGTWDSNWTIAITNSNYTTTKKTILFPSTDKLQVYVTPKSGWTLKGNWAGNNENNPYQINKISDNDFYGCRLAPQTQFIIKYHCHIYEAMQPDASTWLPKETRDVDIFFDPKNSDTSYGTYIENAPTLVDAAPIMGDFDVYENNLMSVSTGNKAISMNSHRSDVWASKYQYSTKYTVYFSFDTEIIDTAFVCTQINGNGEHYSSGEGFIQGTKLYKFIQLKNDTNIYNYTLPNSATQISGLLYRLEDTAYTISTTITNNLGSFTSGISKALRSFTYTQDSINNVENIKCFRTSSLNNNASIGQLTLNNNKATIYYGDTIYWTASQPAQTGAPIINYNSTSNTLAVTKDIKASEYIFTGPLSVAFNVGNGVSKFYCSINSNSWIYYTSTTTLQVAYNDSLKYYAVLSDTNIYDYPYTSTTSYNTINNITQNQSVNITPTIKYSVTFNGDAGVKKMYYRTNTAAGGTYPSSWSFINKGNVIYVKSGFKLQYYFELNTNYQTSSTTYFPTLSSEAVEETISNNKTIAATTKFTINYSCVTSLGTTISKSETVTTGSSCTYGNLAPNITNYEKSNIVVISGNTTVTNMTVSVNYLNVRASQYNYTGPIGVTFSAGSNVLSVYASTTSTATSGSSSPASLTYNAPTIYIFATTPIDNQQYSYSISGGTDVTKVGTTTLNGSTVQCWRVKKISYDNTKTTINAGTITATQTSGGCTVTLIAQSNTGAWDNGAGTAQSTINVKYNTKISRVSVSTTYIKYGYISPSGTYCQCGFRANNEDTAHYDITIIAPPDTVITEAQSFPARASIVPKNFTILLTKNYRTYSYYNFNQHYRFSLSYNGNTVYDNGSGDRNILNVPYGSNIEYRFSYWADGTDATGVNPQYFIQPYSKSGTKVFNTDNFEDINYEGIYEPKPTLRAFPKACFKAPTFSNGEYYKYYYNSNGSTVPKYRIKCTIGNPTPASDDTFLYQTPAQLTNAFGSAEQTSFCRMQDRRTLDLDFTLTIGNGGSVLSRNVASGIIQNDWILKFWNTIISIGGVTIFPYVSDADKLGQDFPGSFRRIQLSNFTKKLASDMITLEKSGLDEKPKLTVTNNCYDSATCIWYQQSGSGTWSRVGDPISISGGSSTSKQFNIPEDSTIKAEFTYDNSYSNNVISKIWSNRPVQ